MIKRLLLLASTLSTAIVVLSFGMFGLEEADAGSTAQQKLADSVNQPNPTQREEKERAHKHSKARELIDDANDVLTRPFDGVSASSNIWIKRGVPAALAFLLYFVVLRVLAGYAVKLRR